MSFYKSLSDTTDIIKYVSNNMLFDVKNFITNKYYTAVELNNMLDSYGNNLLHIATMNGNAEMVEYLLSKDISSTKTNKFGQTPWNLAVMLRVDEVLDKFTKYKSRDSTYVEDMRSEFNMKLSELNKTNISLKEQNDNLHAKVSSLTKSAISADSKLITFQHALAEAKSEVVKLSNKHESVVHEITVVSNENRRLRCDNKRLRDENDDLIDKNKKLKTSVDTLMNSNKK